jgi:hypothetical protein
MWSAAVMLTLLRCTVRVQPERGRNLKGCRGHLRNVGLHDLQSCVQGVLESLCGKVVRSVAGGWWFHRSVGASLGALRE